MSSYLVTGGAGCVGSHLVEYLIKNNHKITIIDTLVYEKQSKIILSELLDKHPEIGFYKIDLVDKDLVMDFFVNHSFDGIFHLAALPSHRVSLSFPYEYFQNDLKATVNILEAIRCVCPNVPILFTSTNKVYSDKETFVSEESQLDAKGPYAISKLQSEEWCKFYANKFGLKVIVTRLFHVVGSRMQPKREIPVFLKTIIEKGTIHLHGKFDLKNEFVSAYFGYTNVYDTVSGIYLLMSKRDELPDFSIFNIGSDQKFPVSEVLKNIFRFYGSECPVINTPLMEHETIGCVAKSEKLLKLGWKIEYNVQDAISDYVNWYINFFTENKADKKRFRGDLF